MELVESYYAVAADLRRNAEEQIAIATRLERYADQLSEHQIRQKSPGVEET